VKICMVVKCLRASSSLTNPTDSKRAKQPCAARPPSPIKPRAQSKPLLDARALPTLVAELEIGTKGPPDE